MHFSVSPYSHAEHAASVAELLAATKPTPATPFEFAQWRAAFPQDGMLHEIVALDSQGRKIGYANASAENPSSGEFETFVLTAPGARRSGVGTALLKAVEQTACAGGATRLTVPLPDDCEAGVAFLQRHGYQVERQFFESQLRVDTFDDSPFADVIQRLEDAGIRFFTLADEPGEVTERGLYALNQRVAPDFPGRAPDAVFPPLDRWQQRLREAHSAHPDLVIIAAEGQQPVGITRMTPDSSTGGLYTPHTSVDRAYRGQGIALALKLLSIRAARRHGAPVLTTSNDSLNAPMLAVNRKLGLTPLRGNYLLGKNA